MKLLSCIITLIASAVLLVRCSLTDVLDQPPPANLASDNAVYDETTARALLIGSYAELVSPYVALYSELLPGVLAGTMTPISVGYLPQYTDNLLKNSENSLESFWGQFYRIVTSSNHVISIVGKLTADQISAEAKNEILGEAYFLRAFGHFQLLRYFGQFYDRSSKYGIVLQTKPAKFNTRNIPRSTVQQSYDLILDDLDKAIANAPDYNTPIYTSKTAAKTLKAKVMLYMGEYSSAITLSDQVINGGKVSLEKNYADIFSKGKNSKEVIFILNVNEAYQTNAGFFDSKRFYYGARINASDWLKKLMATDPRRSSTYDTANNLLLKVYNTATYSPTYFLRLAEVYLIKAEAIARNGGSLADAKAPLNAILARAHGSGTTSEATSTSQLLGEIYHEIAKELAFENGSEWFAGIRFDSIKTVKPSVTSDYQYILPIPISEIQKNSKITNQDQNPGYLQ